MFSFLNLFKKLNTKKQEIKQEETLPENIAFKEGDLLIEHAPEEEGEH